MAYPTKASASDVWSLKDAYKSITINSWPLLSGYNDNEFLGTPTKVVTSIPSSFATATNGQQNYTYAVDITNFNSSDTGVLFELGGGTDGSSFQINNHSLYVQSSGLEDTITSMSSFDNQSGTLYVSVDYTNSFYDIYWLNNSGFQFVVSGTVTSDYAGNDTTGVGDVSSGALFGTNYGAYQGTITEYRSWEDTYFDFSTV